MALTTKSFPWLKVEPEGLRLVDSGFWIDPNSPKKRVIITHGHSDHARGGHGEVIATPETLAIMDVRHGPQAGRPLMYRTPVMLEGGVTLSLHPAGHVLGSAQVRLERDGEIIVVSGDYKRRPDPTCEPFELVPCNVFVTEATFGLPVFRHPLAEAEIERGLAALSAEPNRCLAIGAYALGKAQRVAMLLRRSGYDRPIYLHGALQKMMKLYEDHGLDFGGLRPVADATPQDIEGHVVLCPPSAIGDRWSRRLPQPITSVASGWMRIRGRVRQRGVELPLIISDHADWDELTQTLEELRPDEVWVTHGRDDALVHWCGLRQMRARALHMVGREDEDD